MTAPSKIIIVAGIDFAEFKNHMYVPLVAVTFRNEVK